MTTLSLPVGLLEKKLPPSLCFISFLFSLSYLIKASDTYKFAISLSFKLEYPLSLPLPFCSNQRSLKSCFMGVIDLREKVGEKITFNSQLFLSFFNTDLIAVYDSEIIE